MEILVFRDEDVVRETNRSEGYRGGSQSDKTTIPRVRLMDLVSIVVAQLVDDFGYSIMVCSLQALSNEAL
jgi:hypothetical protein